MENNKNMSGDNMAYRKFSVMMLVSFVVMYGVMFLNMDAIEHYHTSMTRIYMALLMVTPMAVIMLMMMRNMYPDKKINLAIIIVSMIVFVLTLAGLRFQKPIGDEQYMKAMIPHHSSAIMVSKQADISDPEVKKLSEQIIKSQEEEIKKMEEMIDRLNKEKK